MDVSLRGIVHSHYDGIPNGFSIINDVLSRAKLDVGGQAYRTSDGNVSIRRLLSALQMTRPPLDLVWDAVDDNGLPLNPRWRYQVVTGMFPDPPTLVGNKPTANYTSQQPSTDEALTCSTFHDHWRWGGHLNWFPVTYEGTISWDGHSTDDDYNLKLFPPDNAGLTAASARKSPQGYIECEFDSDETIDHFHTPWWNSFHNAVDNNDNAARQMIDGRFAIVTGLFGLDCVHSVSTEAHPVFAIAILVRDDPSDQMWAIFVRNWGNEGFCSHSQHYMDLQTYTFRLPWKQGATTVNVRSNGAQFLTNSSQVTGPNVQFAQNEGVQVTFTLPPPEAGARVNGELHLQWQ